MNRRRDLIKIGAGVAATPVHALPPAAFSPKFFDAHKSETVIAPIGLIIPATYTPGAKGARVNEWMDKFLADGRVEERSQFLSGLGSLDAIALNKHAVPFIKCEKQQQTAILTDLDKYATSVGYQELNNRGRVPATFGCNHPEHA